MGSTVGLVSTGFQIHVHTRGQIQLQYSSVQEVQSPCTERRPRALLHPIRPGSPGQERPSSQLSCTFHIKATMEIGHKNKESDFRTFESGVKRPPCLWLSSTTLWGHSRSFLEDMAPGPSALLMLFLLWFLLISIFTKTTFHWPGLSIPWAPL